MNNNKIINDYFEWLYDLVAGERFSKSLSFRKLLMRLFDIEFTYTFPMDENRATDGCELRYRFANSIASHEDLVEAIVDELDAPCSVLEMMIALAIRCEETIMDDPRFGDRSAQWFWGMITNLGIGSMFDNIFNKEYVDDCVYRFLNREYKPDGKGGLFRVRNCNDDLRDVEIWYQMLWYLDTIS